MTDPIAYARPDATETVRRRLTSADVVLWIVYYVGWIAGGCVCGVVGAAQLDDRFTGNAETALYYGCMAVAVLCAVVTGSFARRAKPLHHAMVWMGIAGIFPAAYMAHVAYRDQGFLWRIGFMIGLVLAGVALAVALSGMAALSLCRRRGRAET